MNGVRFYPCVQSTGLNEPELPSVSAGDYLQLRMKRLAALLLTPPSPPHPHLLVKLAAIYKPGSRGREKVE